MFTYYKPVKQEDHLLYASEIAEWLGIRSRSQASHHRMAAGIADAMPQDKLYYNSSKGLRRVYRFTHDDFEEWSRKLREVQKKKDGTRSIKIDGKTYTFLLVEDLEM